MEFLCQSTQICLFAFTASSFVKHLGLSCVFVPVSACIDCHSGRTVSVVTFL